MTTHITNEANEANEANYANDDRDLNPFTNDQEFGQGRTVLRRLFEISYLCGLCEDNHIAETYCASVADNLDQLHAETVRTLRNPEYAGQLLAAHCADLHQERGEYRPLVDRVLSGESQGLTRITGLTMTGEDFISCDGCAKRFDSLGDLWTHVGIDTRNGQRVRKPECHPDEE